jgi:hypothetical protein
MRRRSAIFVVCLLAVILGCSTKSRALESSEIQKAVFLSTMTEAITVGITFIDDRDHIDFETISLRGQVN